MNGKGKLISDDFLIIKTNNHLALFQIKHKTWFCQKNWQNDQTPTKISTSNQIRFYERGKKQQTLKHMKKLREQKRLNFRKGLLT